VFQSLDFIYTPAADVDAAVAWYVDVLGAELQWRIRRFGTKVAAVRFGDGGPDVLLAGHLEGAPILVYRVADYHEAVTSLRAAGVAVRDEEIPPGPCGVFEGIDGQRLAVYELTRPDRMREVAARIDE
jgi:catechol 2,3-dioxygenase-like lactoylglutathione lyase family enzyme